MINISLSLFWFLKKLFVDFINYIRMYILYYKKKHGNGEGMWVNKAPSCYFLSIHFTSRSLLQYVKPIFTREFISTLLYFY